MRRFVRIAFPFAVAMLGLWRTPARAQTANAVGVHVIVRTNAGLPLTAYVAFVAADQPLWQPAAEGITALGEISFQLPRGRYKMHVGSSGYEDQLQDIWVAQPRDLRVALAPHARI